MPRCKQVTWVRAQEAGETASLAAASWEAQQEHTVGFPSAEGTRGRGASSLGPGCPSSGPSLPTSRRVPRVCAARAWSKRCFTRSLWRQAVPSGRWFGPHSSQEGAEARHQSQRLEREREREPVSFRRGFIPSDSSLGAGGEQAAGPSPRGCVRNGVGGTLSRKESDHPVWYCLFFSKM